MRHRPHGRSACSTRAILITDRTATPPGTESLALLRATRSETPHTHTRSHTSHHDYTTARALHIAFVQASSLSPMHQCSRCRTWVRTQGVVPQPFVCGDVDAACSETNISRLPCLLCSEDGLRLGRFQTSGPGSADAVRVCGLCAGLATATHIHIFLH